jgi:hypothetical protein
MLVVCDTSPLCNLAIIGRLELLRDQFEVVRMPSRVATELTELRHEEAKEALARSLQDGWLIEMSVPASAPYPDLLRGLDAGEIEALRLAIAITADAVLMDEKDGRQCAAMLGLRTIGVIGVLIVAKQTGKVPSVAAEIAKLRSEAGFFVDERLELQALALAGE